MTAPHEIDNLTITLTVTPVSMRVWMSSKPCDILNHLWHLCLFPTVFIDVTGLVKDLVSHLFTSMRSTF